MEWYEITPNGSEKGNPKVYGHRAVYFNRTIFVFGGMDLRDQAALREQGVNRFWFVNIGEKS